MMQLARAFAVETGPLSGQNHSTTWHPDNMLQCLGPSQAPMTNADPHDKLVPAGSFRMVNVVYGFRYTQVLRFASPVILQYAFQMSYVCTATFNMCALQQILVANLNATD